MLMSERVGGQSARLAAARKGEDARRYSERWNMRIAQFINIFLFALVSGVLWGTWFSLSRSIAAISPAAFLEIGRTIIRNLAWPMRILMPASILSALAVLFLL